MEKKEIKSLLIVYGSQTGTAQEVAEQIERMGQRRQFNTSLFSFDDMDPNALMNHSIVIFVVSTTGDGEVPDNMKLFWKFLLQKKLSNTFLNHMEFAVFGLGDSSYAKFNAVARRLQTRLLQLGGKKILSCGLGDDQHELGYFGELYPWLDQLWKILLFQFPCLNDFKIDDTPQKIPSSFQISFHSSSVNGLHSNHLDNYIKWMQNHPPKDVLKGPIKTILKENKRLTSSEWTQDVRHIELEIPSSSSSSSSSLTYHPGDVVYIYPQNLNENVKELADYFHLSLNTIIEIECMKEEKKNHFPKVCTIQELFTYYLDIQNTPRRFFFEQMYWFANDPEVKDKCLELISSQGADLLQSYCIQEKKSYLEVLKEFSSISIPFTYILDMIPLIKPRAFSISSSNQIYPKEIHLTVAIVNFLTPYKRRRYGTCTSYLSRLDSKKGYDEIYIYLKRNLSFQLTKDLLEKEIIFIGPGTGIAPFRAMLQERRYFSQQQLNNNDMEKKMMIGKNYLFFGCRHEKKDYLYEEEWKEMLMDKNFPFKLYTAFSRDQEYKIYVQKRLMENSQTIFDLIINKKALIYIAGNAKRMPSDIYETFRDILQTHGQFTLIEADQQMKLLMKQKRYHVETWS